MSFQQKNNSISTNYRNLGNQSFSENKFYEAMLLFNQSLCFAEKGSLNEALAYASRSKIYYEIGEHEKFLKNSQLSKIYKNNANETLEDRRTVSMLKMAESTSQDQEFFKLSYEPNEKIPFLADCLQIREDEKYRRHIVTEKELKVGDIIALEPNFVACQKLPEKFSRCYNCFKSNILDLIPCQHCAEGRCIPEFKVNFNNIFYIPVMFCSEKCDEELRVLHHFEGEIQDKYKEEYMFFLRIFNKAMKACNNSVVELKLLIEANPGKFSVFDFDLSNPCDPAYEKSRLLAFKSMVPEVTNPAAMDMVWTMFFDSYKEKFIEAWNVPEEHFEFAQNLMSELFLIFSSNTHLMSWYSCATGFKRLYGDIPQRNSFATGSFPFMSLISHSCAPNCDTINVKGDKLMLYVTQPTKEGEQIFISYG